MNLKSYKILAHHIALGLPTFLKMNIGDCRKTANRRLRYIVKYAYENVPLYRRKYDEAGIKPEDIHSIEDIYKLPLITKKDLVDGYPHDIIAKNLKPKDYHLISTSGSTGTPVRIFKNHNLLSAVIFGEFFINKILAMYLKLKINPKSMLSILIKTPDSLEGVIAAEKTKIPAFTFKNNMDVDATFPPEKHIEALNSYKPDTVMTYPSVLRNMALYIQQQNITPHQPGLLMVSGELLDNSTRKIISRTFKGMLLNMYICTECGIIATECQTHSGMHVMSSSVLLELLKDGNPVHDGESGEVVITDLWNQATPIIRYTGLKDIARFSAEKCECNQKTPLLKVVEGRVIDSVVLSDGRLLHPFSLTLALEHIPGIARFQIIQENIDVINILVVPEKEGSDEQAQSIKNSLKELLGESVCINTSFVDEIPHHSNGQSHHVVISKVPHKSLN